jgi:hypothetical protein
VTACDASGVSSCVDTGPAVDNTPCGPTQAGLCVGGVCQGG